MTTTRFHFTSPSGSPYGVYVGTSKEEAFAAMENDGGFPGDAGDIADWIIREVISRSAARRQAHRESKIYRQGSGWILSTWSDHSGCNETSGELSWPIARQGLADWRRDRAAYLAGEVL